MMISASIMNIHVNREPKKILAIKLRELGDTAIWTSALAGLRQLFPNSEIHILVNRGSESLLLHQTNLQRVHSVPSQRSLHLIAKLIELRKYQFDLALGFHATTSLCRWISFAGAKKIGLHHHSWKSSPRNSDLLIEKPGYLQSAIARDYEILHSLGWKGAELPTHLAVSESEKQEAKKLLVNANIDVESSNPLLVLLPGARTVTRRYPRDLWVDMVRLLKSKSVYQICVVADSSLSKDWNLPDVCHDLSLPLFDDLDLRQFMALVSLAAKAVVNDSGPLHIAVALGVSTVALFGPGCFGDWYPYNGAKHSALRVSVDCRIKGPVDKEKFQYCTVTKCDHLSCLRKIQPEEILEALTRGVTG